ncbi:MAG: ABC transporter permease [Steroidobacteraceae bacterium]
MDTASAGIVPSGSVSMLRILRLETLAEYLRLLRTPAFAVPVIGFPILFYLLFGIALIPKHASAGTGLIVLATFVAFGVMAPGLFGIGVTLAADRDRGLLALKRALPMPPGAYLTAKLLVAMLFATIEALLLMLLATTAGHVVLTPSQCALLLVVSTAGVLPFCGLGLLIGTLTKGQAAPAVINLVYLPMSFLSGVLLPLSILPHALARAAPVWPAFHLVQLTLAAVGRAPAGRGGSGAAGHLLALAAMTVLFFVIARRRLQRQG